MKTRPPPVKYSHSTRRVRLQAVLDPTFSVIDSKGLLIGSVERLGDKLSSAQHWSNLDPHQAPNRPVTPCNTQYPGTWTQLLNSEAVNLLLSWQPVALSCLQSNFSIKVEARSLS